MKGKYLSILLMFSSVVHGQEINYGPRATSMGTTGVVLREAWSLQSNEAGLASLQHTTFAANFKSSFLNHELLTKGFLVAAPVSKCVAGLGFQSYGIPEYKEQRASFALAKQFGPSISLGVGVNYHSINIKQYGTASTYSIAAGLQYRASKKLLFGSHISNPNNNQFESGITTSIPLVIEFGGAYEFTSQVLVVSSISKSLIYPTDVRCGLEYAPIEWLKFRGGLNSSPFQQFAGFGCRAGALAIDAAVTSHPRLGYSPQIALSYEL